MVWTILDVVKGGGAVKARRGYDRRLVPGPKDASYTLLLFAHLP